MENLLLLLLLIIVCLLAVCSCYGETNEKIVDRKDSDEDREAAVVHI